MSAGGHVVRHRGHRADVSPSATTRPSARTTAPSPTRAGAAPASDSWRPRACARSCTTAAAACRRPRPTPPRRWTCATTSRAPRATSRARSTGSSSLAWNAATADQRAARRWPTTSSPPSPPRTSRTARRCTPAAGCGRGSATPRAAWRSCWPAARGSSCGASGRRRSSPGGRAPREVCLTLGRLEQAPRARRRGAPSSRGRSAPRGRSAWRCALLRWPSRVSAGSTLLTEAVATLERSEGALELARARIDLGRALVRAGRREAARDHLRTGQEVALRCGATLLVERAHARAARHRRPAAAHGGREPRRPHPVRAPRDPDGGRRAHEPRDRAGVVRHREDGRDPPGTRVFQARRTLAQAARGGTGEVA